MPTSSCTTATRRHNEGECGDRRRPGERLLRLPAISADGRYVAFRSDASSLVAGDTNGVTDVFVHDRGTGGDDAVSVATGGTQGMGSPTVP